MPNPFLISILTLITTLATTPTTIYVYLKKNGHGLNTTILLKYY
jgi:hypothetical protein